jgi:DNA-binding CsgD family transcriptional regulator
VIVVRQSSQVAAVRWLVAQSIAFGITAALLGVVANALFLDAYGSTWLPVTYVFIGLAGLLVSGTVARSVRKASLERVATSVLGGATVTFVAAWLIAAGASGAWVSAPLLVLFPVLIQLGFVFIGGQAGRILDIGGIKASFPRIMAGFPLGAIVGGFAAGGLVTLFGRHASIIRRQYAQPLRLGIADCRGRMGYLDVLERELTAGQTTHAPELLEPVLARGPARTGRSAEARELLARAHRRGFPRRGNSMPISFWAETAAIVHNTSAGAELGELLEPLAGRLVSNGLYPVDTVDRVRALLRLASGDVAGAHELAAHAVTASRRRGTTVFLARELVILAAAQQQLGHDAADTAAIVEEALTFARRTGARIIARDAALFLPEPVGSSHPNDEFGLTPREGEILDHVANGDTNAQIAAALGISAATVRKHLEHAYEKLHVSTRTAAVALAKNATHHEAQDG